MRSIFSPLLAVAAGGFLCTAAAQQGTAAIGYSIQVADEHAPQLEEGMKRHMRWHVQQGDTWTWQTWQALTGPPEYITISGQHQWADLDSPGVDPAADMADWARTGAPHSAEVNSLLWQDLAEWSILPATPPSMVQVFDFVMNPGGDEAFNHVLRKYKQAADKHAPNDSYVWSALRAGPPGPTHFVVVPLENFAALGATGMEPPVVLAAEYGMTEARNLMNMFAEAMTFHSSRIWVLRPDLSHMPN